MPDVAVFQINTGDGDGAEIIFDHTGNRISVSIFPSSASQDGQEALEDRLIDLLGRAGFDDDDDDYEEIVDEILSVILDAGKAEFNEMAQSKPTTHATQTLHSVLYPQTFTFCLKTVSGKASTVPINPADAYTSVEEGPDDGADGHFDINSSLPVYSSEDIFISESFVWGGASTVSRVLVEGNEMLCKAQGRGLLDPRLENELSALQKIRDAYADNHTLIRVPPLLGYIRHSEKGGIIGLLREWIPGGLLRHMDITTVPVGTSQKWASQIYDTVKQLHEIGVVWGDGKASNIIIDEEENAWLIDFGGGWTEGWVDEKLADTIEGDNQAVARIAQFLGVE